MKTVLINMWLVMTPPTSCVDVAQIGYEIGKAVDNNITIEVPKNNRVLEDWHAVITDYATSMKEVGIIREYFGPSTLPEDTSMFSYRLCLAREGNYDGWE